MANKMITETRMILPVHTKKTYYITGMELIKARNDAGLSQQGLADLLNLFGWSQHQISNIESSTLPHRLDQDTINVFEQKGIKLSIR